MYLNQRLDTNIYIYFFNYFFLQFNILIIPIYILRALISLQPPASLQPVITFYTILYFNNYCKLVGSTDLVYVRCIFVTLKYFINSP
jgi:hypothetical protein